MSAPVKHTCPNIDRALKYIRNALDEVRGNIEDKQTRNNIEYELDSAMDILEDLRKDNDALRTWGYEQEDEIKSLNNYISELENKLDEAKAPAQ